MKTLMVITITTLVFAPIVHASTSPAPATPEGQIKQTKEPAEPKTPEDAAQPHRRFGAMVDVGVPDIVGVSVLYRPWRWLRTHVGAASSLAGFGIRGGLTYVPFDYWISPSFTFEGGHMFEGDANWLTEQFGVTSAALQKVGYSFFNLHGGVEVGASDRFLFFIHGGFTYLRSTVRNLQGVIQEETGDETISFDDPQVTYFGPSGKIGFVLYI